MIYTYENSEQDINDIVGPSIFLAGPTVRYDQPNLVSWRKEAIHILEKLNFKGSIVIPEFKIPVKTADFDVPMWEYNALKKVDKIVFWVPRTQELIGLTTNYELGFWVARDQTKTFYGRPNDAYRITYSDKMWNKISEENNFNRKIYDSLEEMLIEAINEIILY